MRTMSLLVLILATPLVFAETRFSLTDKNTKITFTGTKTGGKHEGGFGKLTGSASVMNDATTLKISVEIDTTSLWSDDKRLTSHLKSPDFFGVAKNPKATFVTTKVAKGPTGYVVTGDLTLLGKTKSVSIPADITLTAGKFTLKGTFKIDRNDFGMIYGKGKIDPEVTIKVAVDATK
jgi:polyisoprenoid-binding protein YceI